MALQLLLHTTHYILILFILALVMICNVTPVLPVDMNCIMAYIYDTKNIRPISPQLYISLSDDQLALLISGPPLNVLSYISTLTLLL